MTHVYRTALLLTGVPSLPRGTNWISDELGWIYGVVGKVQLAAEWATDQHGTPVPEGIRIVLEVATDTAEQAIELAENACDSIARIIEFHVGAPHVAPRPLALLDVTPGISRRLYRQWIYEAISINPTRQLTPPEIETVAGSLGKQSERERDALTRGLKWYTDAINEPDLVDRFLKVWVGLESVGTIINRRAHKSGWANCAKCLGSQTDRQRDDKQERGIRHSFSVNEPGVPDAFDRLKKARNKLVHGEWPMSRVRGEVAPLGELAMKVLVSSLLTGMAPEGTHAGTREAAEPVPRPIRGADAQLSVYLLAMDPNVWGELDAKIQVATRLVKSSEVDGQYKGRVKIEIEGEFPCDYEDLQLTSTQRGENGFELLVDKEPELHQKQRIRRKR